MLVLLLSSITAEAVMSDSDDAMDLLCKTTIK